jgi:hypothetical protein
MVVGASACAWICLTASPLLAQNAQTVEQRLGVLEERLREATAELNAIVAEVRELRAARAGSPGAPAQAAAGAEPLGAPLATGVISAPAASPETRPLTIKPDMFVSGRYSAFPSADATFSDYQANFRVPRASVRWAGTLDNRWSAGLELQYRAAADARPEELLNDAYADLRVTRAVTVRAGQFVKPFGFDVQQRDWERESPERAMFAGYIFPGQRDRGVMVIGDLRDAGGRLAGVSFAVAAVNGNRFFADSNKQLNYLFRLRNAQSAHLAYGVSVQLGTQLVPPGVNQTDDENVIGADVQWTSGRLGARAEFVHANRPSTFLASTPVFAPAFVQGARVRSVATTASVLWALTPNSLLYGRFDRFAGDTVRLCPSLKDGSCKINAVNGGVRQTVNGRGFVNVDLQWKNQPSFNYDAVNTALQVSVGVVF